MPRLSIQNHNRTCQHRNTLDSEVAGLFMLDQAFFPIVSQNFFFQLHPQQASSEIFDSTTSCPVSNSKKHSLSQITMKYEDHPWLPKRLYSRFEAWSGQTMLDIPCVPLQSNPFHRSPKRQKLMDGTFTSSIHAHDGHSHDALDTGEQHAPFPPARNTLGGRTYSRCSSYVRGRRNGKTTEISSHWKAYADTNDHPHIRLGAITIFPCDSSRKSSIILDVLLNVVAGGVVELATFDNLVDELLADDRHTVKLM
ncbi:hypothetical protein NA57DRAFT_57425 [Rhizodiscina lignyota]|uniref:Uncharacterized protein n=1 Tax=Rhizodiscina lignyota TaxID=1504668 RepID=A0A9P4IHE8_9PEZI|nr:hypothetical protein NA57DRAFT_57425 [Rhizodiscina lignyota]